MRKQLMTWTTAAAVCVTGAKSAQAVGFYNPDQSSAATAQGQAFSAQADDPSAIYYNPAGLTQLSGTHVSAGSYLIRMETKFDGPGGKEHMEQFNMSPHLYAVSDFGVERWRVGLGINAPFGSHTEWPKNGPLRYAATKSELAVMNLAPTVAWQATEQLSVGLGVNVYYGDTSLEQQVDFSAFGAPDGTSRLQGDGWGVGATVGLLWRPHAQHAVAVVYRSPFAITFEGDARVAGRIGIGRWTVFCHKDGVGSGTG